MTYRYAGRLCHPNKHRSDKRCNDSSVLASCRAGARHHGALKELLQRLYAEETNIDTDHRDLAWAHTLKRTATRHAAHGCVFSTQGTTLPPRRAESVRGLEVAAALTALAAQALRVPHLRCRSEATTLLFLTSCFRVLLS